jgi:hypothetical protein
MGLPAVEYSEQSLAEVGFKPEQAIVLVRLMDQKMQGLLTQEYLDLALGRFADQVKQDIAELRTEVKDLKRELKDDIKDVRYEFGEKIGKIHVDIAKIHVEIAERHNKQLLWMAGIIGMALAAARLLFF